jgi:two-component system sensor histidine kinase KdpD
MSLDPGNQRQYEEERPNPEELLERYHLRDSDLTPSSSVTPTANRDQPQKCRGQLRVYLGAAAGVGKTYAMLNEGRRQKSRGTDVIVGYVETHERPQTQAQPGDLEVLPRKQMTYRNIILEEMDTDTDAILARHQCPSLPSSGPERK